MRSRIAQSTQVKSASTTVQSPKSRCSSDGDLRGLGGVRQPPLPSTTHLPTPCSLYDARHRIWAPRAGNAPGAGRHEFEAADPPEAVDQTKAPVQVGVPDRHPGGSSTTVQQGRRSASWEGSDTALESHGPPLTRGRTKFSKSRRSRQWPKYGHIRPTADANKAVAEVEAQQRRRPASGSGVYDEVKSCCPVNFTDSTTQPLPPRGSRDLLRLEEDGALPYEGARHCLGVFVFHQRAALSPAKALGTARASLSLTTVHSPKSRCSSDGDLPQRAGFSFWGLGFRVQESHHQGALQRKWSQQTEKENMEWFRGGLVSKAHGLCITRF